MGKSRKHNEQVDWTRIYWPANCPGKPGSSDRANEHAVGSTLIWLTRRVKESNQGYVCITTLESSHTTFWELITCHCRLTLAAVAAWCIPFSFQGLDTRDDYLFKRQHPRWLVWLLAPYRYWVLLFLCSASGADLITPSVLPLSCQVGRSAENSPRSRQGCIFELNIDCLKSDLNSLPTKIIPLTIFKSTSISEPEPIPSRHFTHTAARVLKLSSI